MSKTLDTAAAEPAKEKEIDEEVYETQNVNDDFDQINLEKLTFNKFAGAAYHQQSQHIDQEEVGVEASSQVFAPESN